MKKLIALLSVTLALASALPVRSQQSGTRTAAVLMSKYDLDSVTYVCGVTRGQAGTPDGNWITNLPPAHKIKTVGSSTAITEFTPAAVPFRFLSAGATGYGGDLLLIASNPLTPPVVPGVAPGLPVIRTVIAKSDNSNITVDSAINLTNGNTFAYRQLYTSADTATDNYLSMEGLAHGSFAIAIEQINTTTGIDWKVECAHRPASALPITNPMIVCSGTTVTTAQTLSCQPFKDFGDWDACRVCLKMSSTDDGSDVGAAQERITTTFSGW